MRAPEEVYKGQQQGAPKAAEELSREERTRLRAKKKRAGKKRKLHQVLLCDLRDSSLPFFCSLCPLSVMMLLGLVVLVQCVFPGCLRQSRVWFIQCEQRLMLPGLLERPCDKYKPDVYKCLLQDDEKTRRLDSNIIGQKSETALVAAAGKKGKKARAAADVPASQDAMMKYSKSGSVFKRMQEQKEAAAAGILPLAGSANDGHVTRKATNLKL